MNGNLLGKFESPIMMMLLIALLLDAQDGFFDSGWRMKERKKDAHTFTIIIYIE